MPTAAIEAPEPDPQEVVASAAAGPLDDGGKGAGHRADPHGRCLRTQHVCVDGMAKTNLQTAAVERADKQTLPLQLLDQALVAQRVELRAPERFAVGRQLQQRSGIGGESGQAGVNELDDPVRGRRRPGHPPHPTVADQGAVRQRAAHELPEKQHVALATSGQLGDGGTVDLIPQDHCQQVVDDAVSQIAQTEPDRKVVLPQRGHRRGRRLSRPDRGNHQHGVRRHELLDQARRRLVEQLRVVDEQQQAAHAAMVDEGVRRPPQQSLERVHRPDPVPWLGHGQQGCEGPERSPRHGARRRHPARLVAGRGGDQHCLAGQASLTDAGGADDDDAVRGRTGEGVGQRVEFGVPADQGPGVRGQIGRRGR